MVNGKLKDAVRFIKIMNLYVRVGLKGITLLKAYRMLRYWVLTNIFKKEVPWVLEFSVTYRCQCLCAHCSVAEYLVKASKKDELTNEEIKNVLEQAVKIGIPKVDFFGGEPLIKEGILDLIKFGADKGLYMSATTNGWLLTKEFTRELKKAGISCMNVSLDSVSEEKHDNLRGLPGLYKRAVDGIKYCYEEGIPCIVSTYVTKNRIKNFGSDNDDSQLTKIITFAKELKASGIRILFPILSGKWIGDKTKEFTEEEKKMVIDNIDPSFAFIEGAYSVRNKKKVCQSLSGKMFNISPHGNVQLCVTFPDSFGNVKDTPLAELLRGMYSHPIYCKNRDGSCCSTTELARE